MKEREIQRAVLEYLRLRKFFCWKNNTVGIYKKDTGKYIPSQSVGAPDIFLVIKGQIYGLEIKSEKGKQSESQKRWQLLFEAAGGKYFIVNSLSELLKIISKYEEKKET